MTFRGSIPPGVTVVARWAPPPTVGGSTTLRMGFGGPGEGRSEEGVVVDPGGEGSVSIAVEATEIVLRIVVDTPSGSDPGRLTVLAAGDQVASARITGPTSWTFAIDG